MKKPFLKIYTIVLGLTLILSLYSCAPSKFKEIKSEINKKVTFDLVISDPDQFVGEKVLWGGEILTSRNEEDETIIEVIQAPLNYKDKPGNIDLSSGRFLIEKAGFIDPAVYAKGRKITVAGTIAGTRAEEIGETDYVYPVVQALKMYLWKKEPIYLSPQYIYDPLYYNPYYPYYSDPWLYGGPFFYPPFWHPPHGYYRYGHPPEMHD